MKQSVCVGMMSCERQLLKISDLAEIITLHNILGFMTKM